MTWLEWIFTGAGIAIAFVLGMVIGGLDEQKRTEGWRRFALDAAGELSRLRAERAEPERRADLTDCLTRNQIREAQNIGTAEAEELIRRNTLSAMDCPAAMKERILRENAAACTVVRLWADDRCVEEIRMPEERREP